MICHDCKSLDKLPDFAGNPEYDYVLQEIIDRFHTHVDGEKHIGIMHRCDEKTWQALEDHQLLNSELAKYQNETYALRDTFKEDALKCFNKHGRPDMTCSDWHSDAKRIGNPASSQSKDLAHEAPVHLCNWCPFEHGFVAVEERWKKGMYR